MSMVGDIVGFGDEVSDDVFRLLVASVIDYAIYLLDPTGHVRTWNEGARRIKGYADHEILGRHFAIFYTPEDVQAGLPEHGLRAATTEGRWEHEGWRVRKDGSRFWASVVLTALRGPDGRLIGVAKVTRDLTERRRAEEERLQLLARERAARADVVTAEEALRARDTFVSIAAHELRTPVTALKARAQLLRRDLVRGNLDPVRLDAHVERLNLAAGRLAALVDDLLDAARLRSGQLPFVRAPLDLAALVREAVAGARLDLDGRHSIALTVADDLPEVLGDAARLDQVLTNLLDNAVKYSPDGGIIAVSVVAAREGIQISVRDQGIGLPPGSEEIIFTPFGRASNAVVRQLPGLGLGLHLCRDLIEHHGGRLWVESAGDGLGTTFHLWLPAGAAPGAGEA